MRTPSNGLKLVVFDLDGTLIDSRADLARAVNAMLAEVSRPTLDVDTIGSFIGDGAATLVERALETTGGVGPGSMQRAFPSFLRFYERHMLDQTYVYDGVFDALGEIGRLAPGLPLAVLTNKPVRPSRVICKAVGLEPYFFANYGGDSFATKKPDPLGLQTLMREAGVLTGSAIEPTATVLVGDSDVDVFAAHAAGVRSLGCRYGMATPAMLAAEPDAVVDHPREWTAALGLTG